MLGAYTWACWHPCLSLGWILYGSAAMLNSWRKRQPRQQKDMQMSSKAGWQQLWRGEAARRHVKCWLPNYRQYGIYCSDWMILPLNLWEGTITWNIETLKCIWALFQMQPWHILCWRQYLGLLMAVIKQCVVSRQDCYSKLIYISYIWNVLSLALYFT